jgi:hypothetical protein
MSTQKLVLAAEEIFCLNSKGTIVNTARLSVCHPMTSVWQTRKISKPQRSKVCERRCGFQGLEVTHPYQPHRPW